jgi:hypothetical protein
MDSQPAVLPQDLLRSLIVPELPPMTADNHLNQSHRAESGHPSQQSGNSNSEQQDQLAGAPKTAVQEQPFKKDTMFAEMDIDSDSESLPPTPDTNLRMPTRPKGSGPVAVPGHTYSVEEWDALFPIPKQLAKQPTQLPTPGKPVPLPPKSNNPEAIPRFNHLCQVHSLTSLFTFTQIEQGLFASKLEFGDYVYEEAGPFTSKKLAKEAVAVRGLSALENTEPPTEKNGKLDSTQRKSSDNDTTGSPEDTTGDWVAVLHKFTQQHHHAQPEFQYFAVNTRSQQRRGLCDNPVQYCCTLRLEARPDYTFGSDSIPHLSKAKAKRSASKDAVTWLRAVGMLPDAASTPSTTKRRKSSSDEAHTGLTQEVSRLKTEQSPAQLVVELSLRLGLSQPQFKCTPVGQNFYLCTAHYSDRDVLRQPKLEGSLCPTPSVFGQKNAKKMCAGDLLAVLERLTAEVGMGQ